MGDVKEFTPEKRFTVGIDYYCTCNGFDMVNKF